MQAKHFVTTIMLLAGFFSLSNGEDLSLDEIILRVREERKLLRSYRAEYRVYERRLEKSGGNSLPGFEIEASGTYVIDRHNFDFKETSDKGRVYNHSTKEWLFGKSQNGSFKRTAKTLHVPDGRVRNPVGAVERFNKYECNS